MNDLKASGASMAHESRSDRVGVGLSDPSLDLRRRIVLRGAVGLGIAAAGGLLPAVVRASTLEVGQRAPPLVLHTLDGRSIDTRELLG